MADLIRPEYFKHVELADAVIFIAQDILNDERKEKGWDFADSIQEKALSIKKMIEAKCFASDAQVLALENMKAGLLKWTSNEY